MNKVISIFVVIMLLTLSACTKQEIQDVTNNVIVNIDDSMDYLSGLLDNATMQEHLKADLALKLATPILAGSLQRIDIEKVQSYEDFQEMIDKINFMIGIYNDKAETDLKFLSKEQEAYHRFCIEVNRYAPLVNNYNEFIEACQNLDCNDKQSVDFVLKKAISFTVESTLIFGGVFHKTVFSLIGKFSKAFGLTGFARVCPTCVSTVMSSGYWSTKNYIINKAGELSENIVQ
jgi:CRISPR/Cas system CSM-associated protein Csm2 small subunit